MVNQSETSESDIVAQQQQIQQAQQQLSQYNPASSFTASQLRGGISQIPQRQMQVEQARQQQQQLQQELQQRNIELEQFKQQAIRQQQNQAAVQNAWNKLDEAINYNIQHSPGYISWGGGVVQAVRDIHNLTGISEQEIRNYAIGKMEGSEAYQSARQGYEQSKAMTEKYGEIQRISYDVRPGHEGESTFYFAGKPVQTTQDLTTQAIELGKKIVEQYPTGAAILKPGEAGTTDFTAVVPQQVSFLGSLPPIKFISGEYEWQKKILEQAGKKYETPTFLKPFEKFFEPKGQPLPYGLQTTIEFIQTPLSEQGQQIIKGKKFNVFLPQFYIGGKLGQTAIAQKYGKEIAEKYPIISKIATSPIAISLIGMVPLGAFFGPTMETGTAAKLESKYIYDYVKGKWRLKSEVESFTEKIRIDLLNKKTTEEQIKYLNEYAKKINPSDEKAVEGFKSLINRLYNEGTLKPLKVEVNKQGEIILPKITSAIRKIGIDIQFQQPPGLQGVGTLTGLAIPKPVEINILNIREPSFIQPKIIQKVSQLSLNIFNQKITQEQIQQQKQIQKQGLGLSFLQPQIQILQLKVDQIQKQQQIQKQISRELTTQIFKVPEPIKTTRVLPPVIPTVSRAPNLQPSFKPKAKPSLFIPELRRRGKFLPVSAPTTFEKALAIGKQRARQTLGASIRIKGPKGYVGFAPQEEFILAKRTPTILVQKRGSRLSSYFEKAEIKAARRSKGFKLF